jgi:hypothetical protein
MAKLTTALAACALALAATGAARAQEVTMVVGVMNWQGNAATAPVTVVNGTGVPTPTMNLTCEFVAVGRVLGTDRQRVPPLAPGQEAVVTVTADVGGQLIDSIRCQGG